MPTWDQENFVDPSIGTATGAGTSGDPWGTVEYGESQFSSVAGDNAFWIQATADTTLSGALVPSTNMGASTTNRVHIMGFSSTTGDGGVAKLSHASTGVIADSGGDGIHLRWLELESGGGSYTVQIDRGCSIRDCYIHGSATRQIGIDGAQGANVQRNRIEGPVDFTGTGGIFRDNWIEYDSNSISVLIDHPGRCTGNLIYLGSNTSTSIIAINLTNNNQTAYNNSIYAAAKGSRVAIHPGMYADVFGNLIEGFATGIDAEEVAVADNNRAYDCTTAFGEVVSDYDNSTLGATGFDKVGTAGSYADRLTWFAPAHSDTDDNGRTIGALQASSSSSVIVIED